MGIVTTYRLLEEHFAMAVANKSVSQSISHCVKERALASSVHCPLSTISRPDVSLTYVLDLFRQMADTV
jgi:hypothetical protein